MDFERLHTVEIKGIAVIFCGYNTPNHSEALFLGVEFSTYNKNPIYRRLITRASNYQTVIN